MLLGLGFSMICATFFLSIYYNVILAWAIFYTFAGFQSGLS
jgi:solute carrier family 6 amino acid transporter-like protein 5/7/9/14